MREIRFRGKAADNGEWVEGDLVQSQTDCHIWSIGGVFFTRVDPETVSEYTGLRDKNGKRIFEGDILIAEADDGETGIIMLCGIGECLDMGNEKVFGVYSEPTSGNGNRLIIPLSCEDFYYEVIGNKWDNPELLEG